MVEPTPGATATCRHCHQRIVFVNWATRPSWTHQDAGASFQDGMHTYCHRTEAAPPRRRTMPDQPDPSVLGAVLDVSAVLTRMLASMVTCPTCGVLPPRPCFADGSVHPLRISTEETTR